MLQRSEAKCASVICDRVLRPKECSGRIILVILIHVTQLHRELAHGLSIGKDDLSGNHALGAEHDAAEIIRCLQFTPRHMDLLQSRALLDDPQPKPVGTRPRHCKEALRVGPPQDALLLIR
jgi:hypothetical protein